MKKILFVLLAVVLCASFMVGCGKKPGESILTIKGDIGKTNSGSTYVVDQAAFDSKSVELTYNDPWMGDGLKYKGILLKDLASMVKPKDSVKTVALICTDGKEYDVALADALKYDIILAHWVDGQLLTEKDGGPVKVAYPDDAKATYPDENWAWWVVSAEFK